MNGALSWLEKGEPLLQALQRGGPINMARAFEIMDQNNLDGLVVGDPLNIFHVLGYWPQIGTTRLGQPPTTFAIIARDQRQTPAIVTSHFIFYYTFADGGARDHLQSYLYVDAGDDGAAMQTDGLFSTFVDRGAEPLSGVEVRRRQQTTLSTGANGLMADAGGALKKALQAMGLWNGRVAYDHPVIREVCDRHERPGSLVAADNIMRSIRIIKSPLELALMRQGADANAAAVDAVIGQVKAGASYSELRHSFAIESARRANCPVFMTIDRVSSVLPTQDKIYDGQTLFFDGVSHFQHYHGDYARTVFVGEPSLSARRAADAAILGWQAIRAQLRPGLTYAQITALGLDTLKKCGVADTITFGPHSVGLMHSDEPGEEAGGFYRKANLTLQENMVLSVDCPLLETGVGGSVHIEDLVVITADGCEPIHRVSDYVITV